MKYYHYPCQNRKCNHMNDISSLVCENCGKILEPPNVRRANLPAEQIALRNRYEEAKKYLFDKNLVSEGIDFERIVQRRAKAIINVPFSFMWKMLKHNVAYKSYQKQVYDGDRKKATWDNDVRRCIVDSFLFGSEIDIVYAALSVNEIGLSSYGEASLVLRSSSIQERTSCLEDNSFTVLKEILAIGHDLDAPLPPGKFACWQKKNELALVKCHSQIHERMKNEELSYLILETHGERATDRFIELYIYGQIGATTVEKIKLPITLINSLSLKEKDQLDELRLSYRVETY